jgi:AmmeMemoRadiSam system protein B
VVAPHAGYAYSLAIAAEAYARVTIPTTAIVLCPNHTVPPPIVSVWASGTWETPLGDVPVDTALAARVLEEFPHAVADLSAHLREHAIELHLPILRFFQPALQVVPVVVAAPTFERLRELGEGLARAIGDRDDVLLVASTDMTHFKSAEVARVQDERALAHVLNLDPEGLLETCVRDEISMCGVRPTAAVLVAAKALGAASAELVRYGNSGETSGDTSRVVGYAGVVIR